ncbi:hypothetical protein C8R43DRAFT_995787 [Mycena crocata]|nr:hypothetical protein C8R43DRAFT_995787 [Mycena crocata]
MHPMRAIESYGPAELAHGPMFVGFFFNVLLYGVMIIQTYLYFTVFRSDRTWTKTFIACIFLLDTLNTVFDFTYLYDSLITHFADVPFLARANWLFATDPIMTAIIASLVQMFFAWRVKTVTGNIWLAILVSTCALVGLAGGLATSVNVILTPVFKDFIHFKSAVIVWLAAECVGDILITIILVYHLKSNKTGLEGSDILLDRIIRLTMQTGLATSLCATIDLILFLSDPIGLHLIFNFPLSKLYTNSLLCSLNARTPQGAGSADSGRTGLMVSKRLSIAPPPQFRSHVFIDVESIRVSDVSAV